MKSGCRVQSDFPCGIPEMNKINVFAERGNIMLNIIKNNEGSALTVALEGRLDTTTAPQLEGELMGALSGVTKLTLDFEKLEYISSAGLRVLLSAQKVMNKQGEMTIKNVNDVIMEIFEVTGFTDILTIQ